MRQLVVLAFLLLVMRGLALLQEVPEGATESSNDPLTLAAIGFVLLAAYAVAELGSRLRLPKVTGYIVTGIVLGPFVADILSSSVVSDMGMFKTLALGLIATSAGLELDAKAMGRMWRSLSATTGLKVLLLPLFVGGTFFGLESAFHFLGVDSSPATIGLAIIFSALAVGTSPAISLAVLSETKAKGRLSDLVLGISVLKDVVVVICLAIAIAIARSMTSPDAALDASVFIHVGEELGASVLAGLVLAGLLYLYIRFVKAEMLLFVAAMILVVAELSAALHLELLLVFIVAGFVIRNFTPYEHDLLHPLEVVALPVFVVFFANAGAQVNLQVTLAILPFAIALCVARALAFIIAGRLGSAVGGDPPTVQKFAWLAYLPQAGVTLGLVGLAAEQLPALASPITNAGMAVVALNLLIGPITLRVALRKAGEIPEAAAESAADSSTDAAAEAQVSAAALSRREFIDDTAVPEIPLRSKLESAELESQLEAIEAAIRSRVEILIEEELDPWAASYRASVASFFSDADEREEALGVMLGWAAKPAGGDLEERVGALSEFFDDLRAICSEIEVELPIQAEDRFLFGVEGDGVIRRLRKFGARLFVPGKAKVRVVPLRMATRVTIEPRVADALRTALGQWCRVEARVLVELRRLGQGIQGVEEAQANADALLSKWVERFRRDAEVALAYGLKDLAECLAIAGSRELPSRKIRYSKVEPAVTATLVSIETEGAHWGQGIAAAKAALRLALLLERLELHVSRVVESGFLVPFGRLLDSITPEVASTREQLQHGDSEAEAMEEEADEAALQALAAICRKAFPQESHIRIKQLRAAFKQEVSAHELALELRSLVAALPESVDVLDADAKLHAVREPTEVTVFTVPMRRICEQALIHDFLPEIDEHLREANLLVNNVNSQIREHVGVATYAIDVVLRGHVRSRGDAKALIRDGFGRGLRRVDELAATLERVREATLARVREERVAAFEAIRGDAARRRRDRGQVGGGLALRARRRLGELGERFAESGVSGLRRLRRGLIWLRLDDPTTEVQQRYANKHLDAHDLRSVIYSDVRAETKQDPLPPIYGRLYSLESLHERRFFTARKAQLKAVLRSEQHWLEGKEPSLSGLLLVGRHGSGRTSLLNIAQLELVAKRVIRIGDDDDRTDGLLAALAEELRCAPDLVEIRVAIRTVKTAIIIDDLESWVRPDPAGMREFERVLDVIIATRGEAFWLAAVDEDALRLLDPLVALRQAFDRVLTLAPLGPEVLGRVVEVRNRVSGLDVVYPAGRFSRLLRRRSDVSRRDYFRGLARASHGNLRAALRSWHREAKVIAGDTVSPVSAPRLSEQVRFLDHIHPHALAIVVQGIRFGDLGVETLSRSLMLSSEEVMRHLAFLESAGIIEDEPGTYGVKRVPPDIQPTISDALRAAGALQREVG